MPKVKTEKFYLADYGINSHWIAEYFFNPKEEEFSVDLPPEIAQGLGVSSVGGKTFREARTKLVEHFNKFRDLKVETSKVILYNISAKVDDWNGIEVSVAAAVFEEKKNTSPAGAVHYHYTRLESSLTLPFRNPDSSSSHQYGNKFNPNDSYCQGVIPWTEQNESFFRWLEVNLRALKDALAGIMEPPKLVEFINAGKLLTFGKSKEDISV